jgi:glucose-1-phosphate cytidylyltransferase
MKYYAYYGHTDFILCLGYRGDVIKQYFLNYEECLSNDFVLSKGGREVTLQSRDIEDWRISFVDTGLDASIGRRLRAVERYLDGESTFLANYTDGLSDLPLPEYLDHFLHKQAIASFVSVRPAQTFHMVTTDEQGVVAGLQDVEQADLWINGGFFAFKREIFDFIREGEDLVREPFARLIQKRALVAYRHRGFWACMDTFKDKQRLDDMNAQRNCPWEVWQREPSTPRIGKGRGGIAPEPGPPPPRQPAPEAT